MLKPGDLVGPYEIRGFVGQGGMGQVYRAFDPRLERTVALKIIIVPESARSSPKVGENQDSAGRLLSEISTRLLREARAVASLSHPNVVAIYDVGESSGRLYLAMEYVVGSSLRSLVGQTELPLARRVRWLIDVARALEAAHKSGIIHRDIKPENVMVREDGAVKVLDFGIARRTVSRTPDDQHVVDTVTGGGAIAGTPVYMAPEQIKGGDVDARCDQFGWGVMAYELVVGERPWSDTGDVLSLVANILTEPAPSIRSQIAEVPAVVEETIMRALAKRADMRFPSMSDVADALEPFASLSTGGDRVRVTPRAGRPEDDPAYAATTRVPTTLSIEPAAAESEVVPPKTSDVIASSPRRRALALAAPLVLLGALIATVYVVKTEIPHRPSPTPQGSGQRPLSTVPAAETAFREAMNLWHDGATAKTRAALKKAIDLDPTFSAAQLELALQYAAVSETALAQESFQSAYEHRHMLLPRDERLLQASEPYIRENPDVEEWETRMTSVVLEFSRDPELQYYLGRSRQLQGDLDGALQAFESSVRLDDSFAPGLAAIARVYQSRGDFKNSLATTDRCTKRSLIASVCVQTRFELLFANGQCAQAKDEALAWRTLEPQSPVPLARLARALYADGAARPSIEEVFARRAELLTAESRSDDAIWDRALLAMTVGDFVHAEELAREYDTSLPPTADVYDHARPARIRINLLMEMDRMKEAAKVARAFLDRTAAWRPYPLLPDQSLDFFEPIYRSSEWTKADLDAKREDWIRREQKRLEQGHAAKRPWFIWASVYGGFAETREEATEAMEHVPRDEAGSKAKPPEGLGVDFAFGKVLSLLGRSDEAIGHLERVTKTCESFDSIMLITKARLLLGEAYEARGDAAKAKALYEQVIDTWPKGTPSKTTKRATERLALLSRD